MIFLFAGHDVQRCRYPQGTGIGAFFVAYQSVAINPHRAAHKVGLLAQYFARFGVF
jgi:hypothetical protein